MVAHLARPFSFLDDHNPSIHSPAKRSTAESVLAAFLAGFFRRIGQYLAVPVGDNAAEIAMSRIRSPAYPNASLAEVIEYAEKIHQRDRQYAVAREVACQHMGFAGASGSSDRAISALFHYGLAEKVVKGEIRVTDLAVRIIHPHDSAERREALHEAGFNPTLFRELRDKYPGSPPSLSTLHSYLSRQGFASVAIAPAAKAYSATCEFLQRENAYESVSIDDEFDAASPSNQRREETQPMSTQVVPTMAMAPSPAPIAAPTAQPDLELNEPSLSIRGNTVRIEALLDFDGITELEGKLQALKMLMKKPLRKIPLPVSSTSSPQSDRDKGEGSE